MDHGCAGIHFHLDSKRAARLAGNADQRQRIDFPATALVSRPQRRHAAETLGYLGPHNALPIRDAGVGTLAGPGNAFLAALGMGILQYRQPVAVIRGVAGIRNDRIDFYECWPIVGTRCAIEGAELFIAEQLWASAAPF